MPHQNFRVIAIKPLPNCNPSLLKILQKNETYFFYQNCRITENEELVIENDFLSARFFSDIGPTIDINAVVGKNGSGKSSVVELLLMTINNLAYRYQRYQRQLSVVSGLHVAVYFQLSEAFFKLEIGTGSAEIYRYSSRLKDMRVDKKISLQSLYYLVAVNYSHYAYNDRDYPRGRHWLPGVFHKNDGYQIPLVLNPFRDDGNIDINSEKQLVNARVIANVLRPSFKKSFDYRMLTERHRAIRLRMNFRGVSQDRLLAKAAPDDIFTEIRFNTINFDEKAINRALGKHFGLSINKMKDEKFRSAMEYVYYKLVSIALKYDDYREYFNPKNQSFVTETLDDYIKFLFTDTSHISFKVRQAINFIRFEHFDPQAKTLDLDDFGSKVYEIINTKNSRVSELIELLPPPIFTPTLELRDEISGAIVELNDLSSGEKQWNYSVSTFLYHLNNLDSVPRELRNRNAYNHALIVLEEIELYFHPDMQRRFVQHVIDSISQLGLKNIRHIQIIMVTHSPFVLSDIPEQNILFLDNGEVAQRSEVSQTFGGNIHELLAKGFFLRQALVGELARNKIDMVIKRLQPETPKLNQAERDELLEIIILIGEDFLREKLLDMLAVKAEALTRQEQIKLLEAQLKNLKELEDNDQTETQP